MIFIIDDDEAMAECISRACNTNDVKVFSNAIKAVAALDNDLPDLIFLDILLDGPNGFVFLHEIASYSDTAKIPIVIVSSLKLSTEDLSDYGAVGILNKDTMLPKDIKYYVSRYTH